MGYLQIIISLSVLFLAEAEEIVGVCICEKPDDGLPKLTIFYNGDKGLIGAVNDSSNIGLILDYNQNLMKIGRTFGLTKIDVLIDYNTNTLYLDQVEWPNKPPSFGEWFRGLTSSGLKPHIEGVKRKGAEQSDFNDPAFVDELVRSMTDLVGPSFPSNYTPYLDTMIEQLRGPLSLLYKGEGSFDIHNNLGTFFKLNLALADFISSADDVESIRKLDPKSIFSEKTGLHTFLNFIEQIGDQTDLTKVFKTLSRSNDKVLRKITDMEFAVSYEGMDGFDGVLGEIILLLEGSKEGSLQNVITSLLSYAPNNEANPEALEKKIKRVQGIARKQLKKYGRSEEVENYYRFINDINDNKRIISGVNMKDFIELLYFKSPTDVLHAIVNIVRGLLSRENFPHLTQALFNNNIYQQILSTVLLGTQLGHLKPIFSDYSTMVDVVLNMPLVGELAPSVVDETYQLTQDLLQALDRDWEGIVEELKNGELGEDTLGIFNKLIADIREEVNRVADVLGVSFEDALSVVNDLTGGLPGSLTGGLISNLAQGLTGGLGNVLVTIGGEGEDEGGKGKGSGLDSGFAINFEIQRPSLTSDVVSSKGSLLFDSIGKLVHTDAAQIIQQDDREDRR